MTNTATARSTSPAPDPQSAPDARPEPSASPFERACAIAFTAKPFRAETTQLLAGFDAPGRPTRAVPVRSRRFLEWIRQSYRHLYGEAPREHVLREVRNTFEGDAWYSREPGRRVDRRVLGYGKLFTCRIAVERFVLDLARPDGQVVDISPTGWNIVPGGEHCFYDYPNAEPLPLPVAPDDPAAVLDSFRRLLGVRSDLHWRRVLIWLVNALRPCGPYAVLVFHGPAGSGKARAVRFLRNLIDPVSAPAVPPTLSNRKIEAAAWSAHVLALDSVRRISIRVAAVLSRIAFATSHSLTEPHSGRDPVGVTLQRPVILPVERDQPVTPSSPVIRDPDLARNALTVALEPGPALPPDEAEREFEALRPQLLGVLCNAAFAALARDRSAELRRVPRLYDVTIWAASAAAPLGLTPSQVREAVFPDTEPAALAWALAGLLDGENEEWTGRLSALRSLLPYHLDPGSSESLSHALRRASHELRKLNVTASFKRSKGVRTVTLSRRGAGLDPYLRDNHAN